MNNSKDSSPKEFMAECKDCIFRWKQPKLDPQVKRRNTVTYCDQFPKGKPPNVLFAEYPCTRYISEK